ncbi:MAG: hypothetical protein LH660_14455 [Phormidesmis sp. CAN_BIN36]|nr:hypothetical protein [Phormidesmis sp. CAN_BIN36]
MLNDLYRTALWSIILTAPLSQAAYSLPAVPVPIAPIPTTPNRQKVQAIDEPLCFMQTSSGNFVNLERLCTDAETQRNRARAANQSNSPNPVRFGTGKGYAEDAQ